jgi:hypothetical protein
MFIDVAAHRFFSIVLSILMLCSCSSKYGFISVVFLWVVYMTKIRLVFCNSVTEAIEDIFLCEKHKMRSVFLLPFCCFVMIFIVHGSV